MTTALPLLPNTPLPCPNTETLHTLGMAPLPMNTRAGHILRNRFLHNNSLFFTRKANDTNLSNTEGHDIRLIVSKTSLLVTLFHDGSLLVCEQQKGQKGNRFRTLPFVLTLLPEHMPKNTKEPRKDLVLRDKTKPQNTVIVPLNTRQKDTPSPLLTWSAFPLLENDILRLFLTDPIMPKVQKGRPGTQHTNGNMTPVWADDETGEPDPIVLALLQQAHVFCKTHNLKARPFVQMSCTGETFWTVTNVPVTAHRTILVNRLQAGTSPSERVSCFCTTHVMSPQVGKSWFDIASQHTFSHHDRLVAKARWESLSFADSS